MEERTTISVVGSGFETSMADQINKQTGFKSMTGTPEMSSLLTQIDLRPIYGLLPTAV